MCVCVCVLFRSHVRAYVFAHVHTLTQSLSDKHGDRPDAKSPLINLCARAHTYTYKHADSNTHHTHTYTHIHIQPELVLLTALCENGSIFDYYTKKLMPSRRRFDLKTAFRLSIEIAKVCICVCVCVRICVFGTQGSAIHKFALLTLLILLYFTTLRKIGLTIPAPAWVHASRCENPQCVSRRRHGRQGSGLRHG